MASNNEELRNDFDLDKEMKRWRNFLKVWTEPEPEVGLTERMAIWRKNKATLWYYPSKQKKYHIPLFLIYSLVNQPFILDLAPGSSMIEAFVNEGYDVYLIDFGIPGYEDSKISMDDYIVDYIQKGVQKTLAHSGAEGITVIGYCLGGTFAAIYAAIAEEPVRNLILSVAPIDFSTSPVLSEWAKAIREGTVDMTDIIDALGVIPARFVEAGMRLITYPVYISPYLALLHRAYDDRYVERWRRFNKWTKGHIPLSGAAAKQMMEDFGVGNKLVKGEQYVRGKKADLANITASLLVLSTSYDKLVPEELIVPVLELVSSQDKTYHPIKGGHANLAGKSGLPDYLKSWLSERSIRIDT